VKAPAALALAVVAFALYLGVRDHTFLRFDDGCYVTANPVVQGGLTAAGVRWAFTTLQCANWHPLTWLSYLLDVQLFGVDAGAMLLSNAALHALACVLLFLALARLTGEPWPSLLAAALFAVHPLRVESVAWVSERKDVLSAALGFAALWLWAHHVERPSAGRYLAVAAAFALSLLAKPTLVTFPFVLLLLDVWPLGRVAGGPPGTGPASASRPRRTALRLALEKAPLLALSVASSAITLVAQARSGAVAAAGEGAIAARLPNALVACGAYLAKTCWPSGLAVFYPRTAGGPPAWKVAAAALALTVITALALRARRRAPWALVGWLWFLGTLVPVLGLVQVGDQAMADRYTYLPSVGLAVALAWGAARLAAASRARGRLVAAAAASVLAVLSALTVRQVGFWRDHETLFLHALEVTGDNAWAHASLASYYGVAGRTEEALRHAREAVRLEPLHPLGLQNLAASLSALGRTAEAAEAARQAVRAAPTDRVSWQLLGRALYDTGALEESREALRRAVELEPASAIAWDDLAALELELRRPGEAVAALREATRLEPGRARLWFNLGNALGAEGRLADATGAWARALALEPGHAGALRNLTSACRTGPALAALPACQGAPR
jgi:tetratricopeptide (TPR) repeat protein